MKRFEICWQSTIGRWVQGAAETNLAGHACCPEQGERLLTMSQRIRLPIMVRNRVRRELSKDFVSIRHGAQTSSFYATDPLRLQLLLP